MATPEDSALALDPLWQRRWSLLLSGVLAIGAVVVVATTQTDHWSWPLFVTGVAIGAAALAPALVLAALGLRRAGIDPVRASRLRFRVALYSGEAVLIAVILGLLSVITGSTRIAVIMAVVAVVVWIAVLGLGFFVVAGARRRRQL